MFTITLDLLRAEIGTGGGIIRLIKLYGRLVYPSSPT